MFYVSPHEKPASSHRDRKENQCSSCPAATTFALAAWLFSIIIILGYEFIFHLLQLRGIIAAKENSFAIFLYPIYLGERAMSTTELVINVIIYNSIAVKKDNARIVL